MSDAGEAFQRVSALAAEHHADLDSATRLMAAHAWVGGGAPHFAAALSAQRGSLQSALAAALAALAQEAVRQGAPTPAAPAVGTGGTVMSATHGPFHGIDVRAMLDLIRSLDYAAEQLTDAGSRIRATLSALGLPAAPGWTIFQAGQWAGAQVPELARRLARIRRPDQWIPAGVAAFDLFGAYAADGDLLVRLAAGDSASLVELLALREPPLAARVTAWWHRLSPAQRERLVPMPSFGALNGLPAAVRDRANRHLLATVKARLTAELTRLRSPAEIGRAAAELGALTVPSVLVAQQHVLGHLDNITMIERALSPGGVNGHPPALLLAFDLTDTGRLVVSWGDPDLADTTVTYVPGLSSKLSTFAGDIDRARVLWQQAQATAGERRIASIAWLGYNSPQLGGTLSADRSVALQGPAKHGAVELAAFSDGLRAAHQPPGEGRRVVLGHSYGSLVAGKAALLRPGTLAEEFIFVGSPGVGVEHAKELGVPPGRVWVGEDLNDPVAALGHFTADPGDPAFGANHFPVGRSHTLTAHSGYWNPNSASLRNLARITTGHYAELETVKRVVPPQMLMPEMQRPVR